jgi:hypothetical protein
MPFIPARAVDREEFLAKNEGRMKEIDGQKKEKDGWGISASRPWGGNWPLAPPPPPPLLLLFLLFSPISIIAHGTCLGANRSRRRPSARGAPILSAASNAPRAPSLSPVHSIICPSPPFGQLNFRCSIDCCFVPNIHRIFPKDHRCLQNSFCLFFKLILAKVSKNSKLILHSYPKNTN